MPFLQEYTMLDEIGSGGFATVYKVRHNELGYIRAVRVLKETIVDANSMTYQKFLHECKLLLCLGNGNHPNIVHIYQPRLLDNKALVEMDYVDGMDIAHYLKQNKNFVPVEDVIRMATQMSSALAYCHEDIYRFCMDRKEDELQDDPDDGSKVLIDEQTRKRLIEKYKVIHNDIHSGNIMRRENGDFVLLDFGLAIEGDEVVHSSRRKNGAPEFKSPEKWEDDSLLSESSDIYSFGIVLYQCLAGRVPFPYNTKISEYKADAELANAHQKVAPPSMEMLRKEFYEKKYEGQEYKKDYPQWLEDVILKCLQKNPAKRFRNGKELYAAVIEGMAQMSNNKEAVLEHYIAEIENDRESLRENLQKQKNDLQQSQAELRLKDAAFEKERLELKGEQIGLQNRILDLEKVKAGLKTRISDLEEEQVRLRRKIGDTPGNPKWKITSIILLCVMLASGAGFWYSFNHKIREYEQVPSEYEYDIESLQQENVQYQAVIDSLQAVIKNSASDQVKSLTEALEASKRQYDDLNTKYSELNSTYNNLNTNYNNLRNSNSSGNYRGHDAQYWYNNRLFNNHDAQYWYNENEKTKKQRDNYRNQLNENI